MLNFAIGLRQWVGDKLNDYALVKQPSEFSTPLDLIRSIVVITPVGTQERQDAIQAFKDEMKGLCPAAKIQWICLLPKRGGQDSFISNNGLEFVSEDDFSFWFKIVNGGLKSLLSNDYEMSIVLTEPGDVLADYLTRYVKASLRVGSDNVEERVGEYLNFQIAMPKGATLTDFAHALPKNLKMMFSRQR